MAQKYKGSCLLRMKRKKLGINTKIYLHELRENFLLSDGLSPLKPLKGNQISLIPRRQLRGSELKCYSLNYQIQRPLRDPLRFRVSRLWSLQKNLFLV